ncbi:hypothetical protein Tco_0266836 [Tanacetum coccineum]
MPRGHTWLTRGSMWQPDPTIDRPLTGGQPPLTGGLTVVHDGPMPLSAVDHRPRYYSRFGYEVRRSRVLEADVARCDWWIQLQTAGGYKRAVIGGGFEMTKMPSSTHLGYKRTDAAVVLGVRFLVYFHSSVGVESFNDGNCQLLYNVKFRDEVLENIERKDSYVSNIDEPALLVTPLSAFNEDECFDLGGDVDEIELLLHRDPSTPKISVASILEGFTDEPPLVENDDLFNLESKENEWMKILYDAPINDLMTEDKVFDPRIHEKIFSPTYVSLPFKDHHYFSFTYVIRIFLPYFTYPVESPLLHSSRSEDTIFDLGISAFHFSSLEPVASHRSGTFM